VCDHFDVGGQEIAALDVLRHLDRSRFRPYLYTFRPGALLGAARALGVPVVVGHDTPGRRTGWTRRDEDARGRYRRRLAALLRRDRIDVCLIFAWRDGIAAAREAGVPALVERVDGPGLVGKIRDKSACQRIICESRAARDILVAQRHLLRCDPRRIAVIPNGVDARRFDPVRHDRRRCRRRLGLAPEAFVIGTVARLTPQKNLGQFLEALRLFVDRVRDDPREVQALIVGPDGGSGAALRRRARQLRLGRHVRFLGPRRDIPEILRALDVFVQTSLYEGTSHALLEAMAMGLPIVATELPAVAETVDGNGILAGVLDSYQTYLALRGLFLRPDERRLLGRRSRALGRRCDVRRMVRRYERVVVRALADAPRDLGFRRRVALVATAETASRVTPLYRRLRAARVDAHLLGPAAHGGRRAKVPASLHPHHLADAVERLDADVAITACPRIAAHLKRAAPRLEVLLWLGRPPHGADAGHAAGMAAGIREADRVLFDTRGAQRAWRGRRPRQLGRRPAMLLSAASADPAAILRRALDRSRP
jgi:glycosyltransferase involved in cell wall biosynthesis